MNHWLKKPCAPSSVPLTGMPRRSKGSRRRFVIDGASTCTLPPSQPSGRSEERRVGKECRSLCDWSSDVCSSDLQRSVDRHAQALKGIEAQVRYRRRVHMHLAAEPAVRLLDEAILVVVDAHRAEGAFAEVEDFVAIRRTLAGDHVHLVVAVEMVLVGPAAHLLALQQLVLDVRVAGGGDQGRKPV